MKPFIAIVWEVISQRRAKGCGMCLRESDALEPCTICHRPVCPACRAGTGRLADGYTCLGKCWAAWAAARKG
jgi:hypothetical protein